MNIRELNDYCKAFGKYIVVDSCNGGKLKGFLKSSKERY